MPRHHRDEVRSPRRYSRMPPHGPASLWHGRRGSGCVRRPARSCQFHRQSLRKGLGVHGIRPCSPDVDPNVSSDVLRQALDIAQDSGNRQLESHIAAGLAELATTQGDPLDAFEFFTLAIRNYHDSGSFSHLRTPLGELSTLFNRLGRYRRPAPSSGLPLIRSFTRRIRRSTSSSATCAKFWAIQLSNHSPAQAKI